MLAALALCSGLFTTLDFGARTEMRMRSATGDPLAFDFATFPYGHFETRSRKFDLKLDYAASIIAPDLQAGILEPQVYQLGSLSAWYRAKDWVLGVSEGGGYGEMNFSYLNPINVMSVGQPTNGPPPTNIIPCTSQGNCASEIVNYGTSSTSVMAQWKRGRTALSLAPTYNLSGGMDPASRALVPLISEPSFIFALEHQVTRRDVLLTEGNVTVANATPRACVASTGGPVLAPEMNPPLCAPSEQWVNAHEKWRHRLTRRTWLEAFAGATLARWTRNASTNVNDSSPGSPPSQNPAVPYELLGYPDIGASLGYSLAEPGPDRPAMHPVVTDPPSAEVFAYTRLSPVIDPYYGVIDPRVQIGVGILEPIDSLYVFNAQASFIHSTPPTILNATYVQGFAEVVRHLDRYRFDVGVGVRAAYQNNPFFGEFFVGNLYITLLWHEPRIKF